MKCCFLQIQRCDHCQHNAPETKSYDILHPVKIVPRIWYLVGIELIDAHTTSNYGNRYLLTQTDYFTKYIKGIPIPDKTAISVAKCLFSTYCRHGDPVHIISSLFFCWESRVLSRESRVPGRESRVLRWESRVPGRESRVESTRSRVESREYQVES